VYSQILLLFPRKLITAPQTSSVCSKASPISMSSCQWSEKRLCSCNRCDSQRTQSPRILTTSSQSLSSSSLEPRPILMTQRPPYLFASSSHIGLKEKRNRLQNRKIENKTLESYSISGDFWVIGKIP